MTRAHVEHLVKIEESRDDAQGVVFTGLHPTRILLHKSRDESLTPYAQTVLYRAAYRAQIAKQLHEWKSVPEAYDTL